MENNLIQAQDAENLQSKLVSQPQLFPAQYPPQFQSVPPQHVQHQYTPPNIEFQPISNLIIVNQHPKTKNRELSDIEFQISKSFNCWYIITLFILLVLHIFLILATLWCGFININDDYPSGGWIPPYPSESILYLVSIFILFCLGYSIGMVAYFQKSYWLNIVFRFYLLIMIIPLIFEIISFFTDSFEVIVPIYQMIGICAIIELISSGIFIYVIGKLEDLLLKRTKLLKRNQ